MTKGRKKKAEKEGAEDDIRVKEISKEGREGSVKEGKEEGRERVREERVKEVSKGGSDGSVEKRKERKQEK